MTQPIQAVQIYYEHPFGAEREVLREFFSFVGCLVKTTMMPVETILEKHKSLVNPGSERITHLFLTDRLPEGIVLSKNEIWCSFRILKRELAINGKEILHNADQKISAEQFEKTTLDVIIRRIWKDDEAATQSLLHINTSFWQLDLFEFLQIKSTSISVPVENDDEVIGNTLGEEKLIVHAVAALYNLISDLRPNWLDNEDTSLTLDISIDGRKAQSCGGLVAMKEEGFTFGLED